MMTIQWLLALCALCLVPVKGWEAPGFCHGSDCPEFTVVHTYEDFEERFYKASHWMTVEIPSFTKDEVKNALWKLYHYTRGENEEKAKVNLPWPSIVVVEGEADQRLGSVSWPVPAGTHLPKPNDDTIMETDRPAATVYVRSFGGMPSEAEGYEQLDKLKASVKAMGKSFVPDEFVAAAYDPPMQLINRHNEVWLFAD